ncbi:polymorphic outer membrane protein middle domain-containing protein [Chlamydia vaughanii]|uniref:polymorphic outer membrane protein middle domain-containing protein n=1 Tax=Chlamydia vaughanii TaxID=3112552 RepID=UPI0032B2D217
MTRRPNLWTFCCCAIPCLFSFPAYSAVKETLTAADSFDGSNNAMFNVKSSANEEGTLYSLSEDILIQNVSNILPRMTGCFKNTKGNLNFSGNNKRFVFLNNTVDAEGKMIFHDTEDFLILANFLQIKCLGSTTFKEGKSAIKSRGAILFKYNSEITFESCFSEEKGGAIYCIPKKGSTKEPSVTFITNEHIKFAYNESRKGGGAIYAANMHLTAMGPTLFIDNTAHGFSGTRSPGGAIAIAPKGELSLFADSGDITFAGNTILHGRNYERNAVHLEDEAFISFLSAKAGKSIVFYDSITSSKASSIPLMINESFGIKTTGTIFFSSGDCKYSCSTLATVNFSRILQDVILAGGTLSISSGSILSVQNFIQRPGSQLIVDQSSMLRVNENAEILNLTIPVKLSIPTQRIENSKLKYTTLSHRQAGKISLLGNNKKLSFLGSLNVDWQDEDFYENLELANPVTFPLVIIETKKLENTHIEVSQLNAPINPYGYQGSWKLEWLNTPTTRASQAECRALLLWTPKGYRPRLLDSQGNSLVPNSLWNAFVDLRGIHSLMDTVSDSSVYQKGFWAAEMSNFFHKDHHKDSRGFRHTSNGYAIGISQQTPSKNVFNLGFFHLRGMSKDASLAKNREKIFAGSVYFQHTTPVLPFINWSIGNLFFSPECLSKISKDLPIIFSAQATYRRSRNTLTVTRKSSEITHGYWNTHCVGFEASSSLAFDIHEEHNILHNIFPFINLQGVYAYQRKFKEEGEKYHTITSSQLANLSLPMGIRLEGHPSYFPCFYSASISFISDLLRQNPSCTVVASYDPFATWETQGTNLSRQALTLQLSAHGEVLENINLFSKCCVEIRKSSQYYSADIGSQFLF